MSAKYTSPTLLAMLIGLTPLIVSVRVIGAPSLRVVLKGEKFIAASALRPDGGAPLPYFSEDNEISWTQRERPPLLELCTKQNQSSDSPLPSREVLFMRPRVDIQHCPPNGRFPAGYAILVGLDDTEATRWNFPLIVDGQRGEEGRLLHLAGLSRDGIIVNGADGTLDVLSPLTGDMQLSYPTDGDGLTFRASYDSRSKRIFAEHRRLDFDSGKLKEYRNRSSRTLFTIRPLSPWGGIWRMFRFTWPPSPLSSSPIEKITILGGRFLTLVQRREVRGGTDLAGITIFDLQNEKFVFEKRLHDLGQSGVLKDIELAEGNALNFGILYFVAGESRGAPRGGYRLEHYVIP